MPTDDNTISAQVTFCKNLFDERTNEREKRKNATEETRKMAKKITPSQKGSLTTGKIKRVATARIIRYRIPSSAINITI